MVWAPTRATSCAALIVLLLNKEISESAESVSEGRRPSGEGLGLSLRPTKERTRGPKGQVTVATLARK